MTYVNISLVLEPDKDSMLLKLLSIYTDLKNATVKFVSLFEPSFPEGELWAAWVVHLESLSYLSNPNSNPKNCVNVKQRGNRYHFHSLWHDRAGIKPTIYKSQGEHSITRPLSW